ncbi:TonB-dependent receptor [Cytophaga hutchinsonii]|uniref:Probable tonB-dependent receptor n=1 Tax=Cytophaga hutchinsonii (strain ATCC 33406 / DSM 1761 / CIP 103989 / NBRC 15051 / NCIMB 9469 / D465) TaxID=269798 RepID=A0A6N4SNY2_CYTH3|nr:TonB-dependent receptor [Cytophaga hutchinsonii]ABG58020.1 probable tonB-dependent receptor [Cytophaga hutchinsonii ATCC 33406]SFX11557.1 iron complex outermembrane recepter protein [Cytophaga hutchinsonii ATCC 33406]
MLKNAFTCFVLTIAFYSTLKSQAQIIDTVAVYEDKEIEFRFLNLKQSPASVDSIQPASHQPAFTLVPALNTLPGVRMEERSPGSYRLSIRGSLLRSPFGVRNVKIYLNDFPLTDAGGNTYLNSLDASGMSSMEIWKGPYGSLYGANTGGVVRVRTYEQQESTQAAVSLTGGSYGLFHQTLSVQQVWKKQFLKISQAFQRSDGYREQSTLQRQFYQASYHADYHKGMRFKALGFYSDLNYQTPGGLTLEELNDNPRAARPAAGVIPGAVEQHAQIYNKMLYTGIGHEAALGNHFRHVVSVFASHTNFQNPAISNYEIRKEMTYGLRTYVEASGKQTYKLLWNWNIGAEWQKTQSAISNYRNNAGTKDTLLAENDVQARQYFLFTQFSATLFNRLIVEAGLSLNNYIYNYRSVSRREDWVHQPFEIQLMPRVACSYKLRQQLLWRASVSKGYSPPTIAEIRPNDNTIHTDLQAEYGWNYETGLRFQNNRLRADVAVFYYALKQAIVSRINAGNNQYFVNAGGTSQPGLETQLSYAVLQQQSGLVRLLELKNSITCYVFSFDQYKNGSIDYSGNRLTGVPRTVVVSSMFVRFAKGMHFYLQYNYTGKIPLNDANTMYAANYHLVQSKIGVDLTVKRTVLEIFLGADNLLNQRYSLGNDLNAFSGRYYNAAAARNFYGGTKIVF